MDIEAVWAYVLLMALVVGVVALPPFRAVDNTAESTSRYASIDGLRGFLALGVFVFHLVVTYRFNQTGVWTPPTSRFYALLGPVGVSLFFMITGFLFWGKLLRARGRPDWRALFVGRLFRIGPMYLAVVVMMLIFVFAHTGLTLREPGAQVASSILQWLALGMIDTQPAVNGYEARHVLAGVTWTIFYEWAFYLSLLGTAWFARGRHHLVFVTAALVLAMAGLATWQLPAFGFAALFQCGMAVASLLHANVRPNLPDSLASALALSCLALVFVLSRGAYGGANALLLAVFFYLVCTSATLFGLLTSMPARRLGNISYSLYLMQGLVLSAVFGIDRIKAAATASVPLHWLAGGLSALLLLVSAAVGYVCIERAGIQLGKRVTRPGIRQRVDQEVGRNGPVATPQQAIEIGRTSRPRQTESTQP
ncbi:MAG: acyltransferase [Burkholderiales bacterium]|nr:acyltransferase [Burkholderiales bacterium]